MGVGPDRLRRCAASARWARPARRSARWCFNLLLLPRVGGKALWREARGRARALARHRALPGRRAAADPDLLAPARDRRGGVGDPRLRRRHGLGRRHDARPRASCRGTRARAGRGRVAYFALRHRRRDRAPAVDRARALLARPSPSPSAPSRRSSRRSSSRCRRGSTTTSACRWSPASCSSACRSTQGGWDAWLGDPESARGVAIGAAVNALLAVAGWLAGGVNRSGVIAGVVLAARRSGPSSTGGATCCSSPSSSSARLPPSSAIARKAAAGIAQEKGGRRGARHALAKTPVAGAGARSSPPPRRHPAGALRAGLRRRLRHRRRRHRLERDRPGVRPAHLPDHHAPPGAARHRGRGLARRHAGRRRRLAAPWPASASRSGFVGAAAWWIVPSPPSSPTCSRACVGATLERRGLLDNEAVNFLNTLFGAVLAALLGAVAT